MKLKHCCNSVYDSETISYNYKGCKIAVQKKVVFGQFCKDQEVVQQGSVGYTTSIRRLYNKDQDVIQ